MSDFNKIEINPDEVKFIVDAEKHVVVCYIENTERMFLEFLNNNSSFGDLIPYVDVKVFKNLLMNNKYIGKAVCAEDDAWNEEYGRRLAYHRMRDKISKAFFKRGKWLTDYIDDELNKFCDVINLYGEKLWRNKTRREKLLGLDVVTKDEISSPKDTEAAEE